MGQIEAYSILEYIGKRYLTCYVVGMLHKKGRVLFRVCFNAVKREYTDSHLSNPQKLNSLHRTKVSAIA